MDQKSAIPTAESVVLRLTDAVSDVRYESVVSTLMRTLESLQPGARYAQEGFEPTFCAIVMVDERGGAYTVRLTCSQGSTSKIIGLLEIAKHLEVQSMFPL